MRKILLTSTAVILATNFVISQSFAACPEAIGEFDNDYKQTLAGIEDENALTNEERADLESLRNAAQALHEAGSTEACNEVIARAWALLNSAVAPQAINIDDIIGRSLSNADKENLGEVEEVLIDPASGRIAYLVVEHGGLLGVGENAFAVPWRAVRVVPDDGPLLLDITEAKLEGAPHFNRKERSPLNEREWALSVHSYYGVRPYWQDVRDPNTLIRTSSSDTESMDTPKQQQRDKSENGTNSMATGTANERASQDGKRQKTEISAASEEQNNIVDAKLSDLSTKIDELKKNDEHQSKTINELDEMKTQFRDAKVSNEQIVARFDQLQSDFDKIATRIEKLSKQLHDVAAKSDQAMQGRSNPSGGGDAKEISQEGDSARQTGSRNQTNDSKILENDQLPPDIEQ